MRKAVVSVGIGAVVAHAGVTAVGASEATGKRQLELTGAVADAAEVNTGQGFVGTRFVGTEELMSKGRNVGRGVRSCEVVAVEESSTDNRAQFQCLITLGLTDGVLTLQAMPTLTERGLEAVKAAVTGGTGAFRHARGEALVAGGEPREDSLRHRPAVARVTGQQRSLRWQRGPGGTSAKD